jgi:hypothetical protein
MRTARLPLPSTQRCGGAEFGNGLAEVVKERTPVRLLVFHL